MQRTRIQIIIEVDLDPVPGAFSTPESALYNIEDILVRSIPHYNPVATATISKD